MFELTHEEQEYVITILKSAHTELLRDLHHADSRDFRRSLRTVLDLNERIAEKLYEAAPAMVAAGGSTHPRADF